MNFRTDYYKFHRLALQPTKESTTINDLKVFLHELSESELKQLLTLIIEQKLHFFWLKPLRLLPDSALAISAREQFKQQCFKDTTRYLAQKRAIIEFDSLFEVNKIPYALFKGAHIREVVYENPAHRPSADIDLLVSSKDNARAIRALCTNGYILVPKLQNITHEISLVKDNVHLDLHWHIMRPGRARVSLTDLFLQSRERINLFWGLNNDTALLVLLTHPVFTEYSTGPQSSIVKLVDLQRWITRNKIDWQRLLSLLENTGLKTAAWITATLLADLTGCRLPDFVYKAIRPTNPKRFLLQIWLDLNLSSKFVNYPVIPKYVFTLLAHDNVRDVLRFIRILRTEHQKDQERLQELLRASKGEITQQLQELRERQEKKAGAGTTGKEGTGGTAGTAVKGEE